MAGKKQPKERPGSAKMLMDAVLANDLEQVREHIKAGADVEQLDDECGISPLAKAAELGNVEIVRALLKGGAKPDFGGVDVPLAQAACHGHIEAVQELIRAGADVNQMDEGLGTPLMTAAFCGHFDIIKILVNAGADVNTVDENGHTAFREALRKGHQNIIDFLTPLTPPSDREKAIALANQEREREARLKDPAAENIRKFLVAALNANFSLVKQFLDNGMNVNARSADSGQSALHKAVAYGQGKMAQFLIEAGAELDVPDKDREITPLGEAAMRMDSDMVRLLIQAGANVNFRNSDGETPLHAATWSGDADVVKLLIQASADVDTRDKTGKTPLMEAVSREHDDAADLLIKAGAEWNNLPWHLVDESDQPLVRAFLDRLKETGKS